MSFLSKVFRYENENGDSITFTMPNGFVINKPIGIDTVSVSLSQVSGIGQIGSTIQSVNIQPRPVSINGKLCGYYQMENKEKLLSVIRPDLEGKLYADDYYLSVKPTATPSIEAKENFASFEFTLLAAYPYWRSIKRFQKDLSGVQGKFKFPWNISREYRFGELQKTQFFMLKNTGQLPTPFTAVFYANGECENPKLTHVTSGKYLLIKKVMEAGERITVEITHGRTYVTSTIYGDIRGALSVKSTFNRLFPGDNILKPEAETGGDALEVSVSFSEEKVGVSL